MNIKNRCHRINSKTDRYRQIKLEKQNANLGCKTCVLNYDPFNNIYKAYNTPQINFSGKKIIKEPNLYNRRVIMDMCNLEAFDVFETTGTIYSVENYNNMKKILKNAIPAKKGASIIAVNPENPKETIGMGSFIDYKNNFKEVGPAEDTCILHMVVVKEEFRNKGYFKAISEALYQAAHDLGYKTMVFDTETKVLLEMAKKDKYKGIMTIHEPGTDIYEAFKPMIHDSGKDARIVSIDLEKMLEIIKFGIKKVA